MTSRLHLATLPATLLALLALAVPALAGARQAPRSASRQDHAAHATGQDQKTHKPGSQTPAPAGQGHGHMDHKFDNPDAWAKTFDDPGRDEWQLPSRVIDALDIRPGQVVADIGAGTGYFTMRIAGTPAKPKVFAVDIEPSMLEHIRHRAAAQGLTNVVAVQGGSDRTNLPEPVDLVLMVDTYHHIPDRTSYFAALRSLMKPGARLAIVDFRKDSPTGPPPEFRFTAEQITAELTAAGFSRQAAHDFLPRQLFLVFAPGR